RLERPRLAHEPVVCILARTVERHGDPLHAVGAQALSHGGREASARGADAELLRPELRQLAQEPRQVGATKRVSTADQEGAPPARPSGTARPPPGTGRRTSAFRRPCGSGSSSLTGSPHPPPG